MTKPCNSFMALKGFEYFIGKFFLLLLFSVTLNAQAEMPKGEDLLSASFSALKPYGSADPASLVKEVDVSGQPFAKALQISTLGKSPGKGEMGIVGDITTPLKKGDVLWMSFKARKIESRRETGDAFFEARVDNLVNGKYRWPTHVERGVSVGPEWTETSIPFVTEKDVEPGNARFIIRFDSYEESFELGPVTLKNYGSQVKVSDLPKSVVNYGGSEANAPWRKEAAERIEKFRKGDLAIKVVDSKGRPVLAAQVAVRMTRNAYNWGTAVNSQSILEQSPSAEKYREVLKKYFNQVVFENEMKYKNWILQKPEDRGIKTKAADVWLKQNGFTIRGHVMVWPSFSATPPLSTLKNDAPGLKAAILQGIEEQTTVMRGEFDEWDVMNEATLHHDFADTLGRQELVNWFNVAKKGAPTVKLFYNDFTMFHGKGDKSNSQKFFEIAKFLKDNGAAIDAIGEQAHIGGTPPGIPDVLERLDYFTQLGLPIQITEFDINSSDEDFQAHYLRDFMIALYSHPNTMGFVQWGFYAPKHWFPMAALWNGDWTIRKHGQAYIDLVTKEWWTNADLKTAADGASKVRGFTGEYEITVQHKGKKTKVKSTLDNKGRLVTVMI